MSSERVRLVGMVAGLAVAMAVAAPSVAAEESKPPKRSSIKGESYNAEGERIVRVEPKYPQATRPEPSRKTASKIAAEFNKLVEYSNAQDADASIAQAELVLAHPKANAYERAVAAQVASIAWLDKDGSKYEMPLKYMARALEENALDNNGHFDLMYQMAQMQLLEEDYTTALATISRFLAETRLEKPEAYALQGNAYYRQDKYPEAIESLKKAIASSPTPDKSWSQMLMAAYFDSDQPLEAAKLAEQLAEGSAADKIAQMNLANVYLRADQPDKAAQVFDRLRQAGLLTEAKDYEFGYKLLANVPGREKDAAVVINEGLAKAVLQPSYSLYNYLGQTHYFADQIPQAIDAWGKAAPLSSDGEAYLNLAKVLSQEGNRANDARANARQALAKGVKKPGDAWMVIARAEYDLNNRNGVIAAYREAAKHPETRDQAARALKQMGAK